MKSCLGINLGVDRQACAFLISAAARTTISTINLGLLNLTKSDFNKIFKYVKNLAQGNERKDLCENRIKSEANVSFNL